MSTEYKDTIESSGVNHDVDSIRKGQVDADEIRLAQMGI